MASYPSFTQLLASTPETVDDRVVDRSEDGTVKVRAMFPIEKKRFAISHKVSRTEAATMAAFYTANRLVAFDFEWFVDHLSYTCVFESSPKYNYQEAPLVGISCVLLEQ